MLDPTQLQAQASSPLMPNPPQPGSPTTALTFNDSAVTDGNGIAVLNLTASDPGTPRCAGSMAATAWTARSTASRESDGAQYTGPVNQWNFISILLGSGFTAADPVTWTDIEPIFTQYANLSPVMNRFLDLAAYASVVANASLLTLAFGLDGANPNAMPVTRDLSPAKRQAILSFLANPLPAEVAKAAPEAAAKRAAAPGVDAGLARRSTARSRASSSPSSSRKCCT